jgi:hypothetical protein
MTPLRVAAARSDVPALGILLFSPGLSILVLVCGAGVFLVRLATDGFPATDVAFAVRLAFSFTLFSPSLCELLSLLLYL